MIAFRDARVCRACAARMGRFLEHTNDWFLASLWDTHPRVASRVAESAEPMDAVVQDFIARVDDVTPLSPAAHFDLAMAYAEMGLAHDAIRSAAFALSEIVPDDLARETLDLIFGERFAKPTAFATVVRALARTDLS